MAELRVTSTGTIKLFESDDTSSVTIASPASLGANRTVTLPDADVNLTQVNTMPLANLDIDGGTDIGAAIVDADLFIIDDGAGGTNRKVTASRIKTYAGASGDITTIDSIFKADVKIGEDDQTKIDFETANEIHFYADNAEQVYLADGIFGPQTDNDVDLGASGVEWKDAYFDGTVTADAGLFDTLGVITTKDLGIGVHIREADSSATVADNADALVIENSASVGMSILSGNSNSGNIFFGDSDNNDDGFITYEHNNERMIFGAGGNHTLQVGGAEVVVNNDSDDVDFRVESNSYGNGFVVDAGNNQICFGGVVDAGTLSGASTGNQFAYELGSFGCFARNGNPALRVNRTDGDGGVMTFASSGGIEGTISISGSTTSYGAFCGTHWSRLADNSKPTILRGTVMESIATMINWYQVEFEVNELDDDKNVKGKIKVKKSIDLPDGGKIGDDFKYTHYGVEYTGKIIKEDNERLPMCKISDTAGSKAVYGVFMAWDDDDDGTTGVNDMNVASLGAFVVRIHKDQTVAIGDYLVSNGDGTAKKQADDILRASTIAKVTSTEKTHTHADGSYCVPCTIHCG